MSLTWARIGPLLKRNLKWMQDDVRASFTTNLNIATLLQVCSYTEALARLKAGTVVEVPSDGTQVFGDFMRAYFNLFGQSARKLGSFYICSKRESKKVKLVDAYEAFYRLWRHGVVHEHLAKATSCLTRTSDDGDQAYL